MPIVPIIPDTDSANAGGTAIGDLMTQLHAFAAADPGDFTLELVTGSPVTSFAMRHSSDRQINLRVSGGEILMMIDPDGTIADSASPGSPTNASPEVTFIPSPTGIATACGFAQYGDAILFYVKDSGLAFQKYCSHVGKIAVMKEASDEEIFFDGWGCLGYSPNENPSTGVGDWGCTNSANSHCLIRVGEGSWLPFTYSNISNIGDLAGLKRFSAIDIHAGNTSSPNAGTDPSIGHLKYIKADGQTSAAPLGAPPSSGSNQAMLRLNDTSANTRMVALWNKTTTP